MTNTRGNELLKDEFYMILQDVLNGRNVHDNSDVTGDMNTKDDGDQN